MWHHKRKKIVADISYLSSVLTALIAMLPIAYCTAQYAPAPPKVDKSEEPVLRTTLQQGADEQRSNAAVRLGALYYDLPIKAEHDLDSALHYALLAKTIASSKRLLPQLNEADFLLGMILIAQNQAEKAEALLPEMSDTFAEKLMLSLSYSYVISEKGNSDTNVRNTRLYAQKAKLIAGRHHEVINSLQADLYLAEADQVQNKFAEARDQLVEVLKRYQQLGYDSLQYVYCYLYDVYESMDDDATAFQYITQAVGYAKKNKDSVSLGDCYILLGDLFQMQNQKEIALGYFQSSYAIRQRYPGYLNIYATINRVSTALIDLHRYQEALSYVHANFTKYPPVSDDDFLFYIQTTADCYLKLKQYDQAEKWFQKEFNYAVTHNLTDEFTYHRMAFFYVESHQYSKALPYLRSADSLSPNSNIHIQAHLQYMYYLADSALQNYKEAMHHLAINRNMNDTMHSRANRQALQKVTVQYETEKKNEEIKSLDQKQKLQEAELHSAMLTQRFTIAGISVLLALTALLYNQYLQKRKNASLMAKKNEQLESLVSEKEWLIKEIHHRVKNNLHTIICLLQIQAEFLEDEAFNAISNSQNRIYAMSLIHQKLYLAGEKHEIDMAAYVPELIQHLRESYGNPDNIRFQMDIESVMVNVSIAVTLGLIINEAVSNSIKYAFPNKTGSCIIGIGVHSLGDLVTLNVGDNGVGFDPESSTLKGGSLGLKLIRGLCGDIRAEYSLCGDKGTQITVKFVPSALADI